MAEVSQPKIGVLIFATESYMPYAESLAGSLLFEAVGLDRRAKEDSSYLEKMGKRCGWITGPGHLRLDLPWPLGTLLRPFWYRRILDEYQGPPTWDYIFAMDADLIVTKELDWSKMIGETIGTLHPGFTGPHKKQGSFHFEDYEAPVSRAEVPHSYDGPYYAGGLWGGSRTGFRGIVDRMCEMISEDLGKGIIATWHDESYINRIFYETQPARILSPPEYLCPDEACEWYKGDRSQARILALSKDHAAIRTNK